MADEGLGAALAAGDPAAVLAAARRLIGKGPGLTPLGDDVLAGAAGRALLLGEAAGDRRLLHLVAGVAPALCCPGPGADHAPWPPPCCATPAGARWTTPRPDCSGPCAGAATPATALDALLALGHSSGTGLATGLLAGAAAAGGAP